MKIFATMFITLIVAGISVAQDQIPTEISQIGLPEYKTYQSFAPSWNNFDRNSGEMQVSVGQDFIGSTIAYMRKGNGNLLYGVNLDILKASSQIDNYGNDFYMTPIGKSSLVIPLMFSMKYRLLNKPNNILSPYAVIGVGPALGIGLNNIPDITNSISSNNIHIGASGYVGAGVDLLLMEYWAFSLDVRYNAMYFNNSIGFIDHFNSLSFGIGFIRAFSF